MVSNSSKKLSYKNFSGVFDPRFQVNLNSKLRESTPPNVTTLNDFDDQGKIDTFFTTFKSGGVHRTII